MEIQVTLTDDHIHRVSQCSPDDAIVEMIWNAIDAGATKIRLLINRNDLDGIETIEIIDNGDGIERDNLENTFGLLGKSTKQSMGLNSRGRPFHGRIGEGRFKAYAIGTKVQWKTKSNDNAYVITGNMSKLGTYSIEEGNDELDIKGTHFTAYNGHGNDLKLPSDEKLSEELTVVFAPELLSNKDIKIYVGGIKLDPKSNIRATNLKKLSAPFETSSVRTVIWMKGNVNNLTLCDSNFLSRVHEEAEIDVNCSFSIFIASPIVNDAVSNNTLTIQNLTEIKRLKEVAISVSKKYILSELSKESVEAIEMLKAREVYPYEGEPISELEVLERKVFDVCTTKIIDSIPSIAKANKDSQSLTFQLLKQAIETSPSALRNILQKLIKLPEGEIEKLSELLEKVTLEGLIKLGKTINDRLSFLAGFEQLVFDHSWKRHVKERRHIHKILEQETWIFGEQFALGSSDDNLNRVLDYHKNLLNHGEDIISPEKNTDKNRKLIPDLVLGRQFKGNAKDQLEHLVIELKRPSVKIGFDEKGQIEKYAAVVSADSAFDKSKTKWIYYVVSTDVDDTLKPLLSQTDREYGQVAVGQDDKYQIYVKTWGEIIQSARGRLDYLKEKLDHQSTKEGGIKFLREKFPEIMLEVDKKKEKSTKL